MDKLNANLVASGVIHLLFEFCLKFKQHHRMFLKGTHLVEFFLQSHKGQHLTECACTLNLH